MRPRARTLVAAAIILFATVGVGLAVTGGVGVDNTVVLNDDQGPEVAVVTGGGEMGLDGPSTDGQVEVVHDNGEATISGPQGSTAQLDASEIEGTWTRATSLDTAGGELTIDPADKPALSVSGDVSEVEFTDAALDDGSVDLRYVGTSSSGVTVRGLQANTDIAAVVDGAQTVAATTNADGTVTLDLPESASGSLTDVELVTTSSPEIDNESASPQDNAETTQESVELSIDVSDSDFGGVQGDDLDVTFIVDGEEIDAVALSENGTASTTTSVSLGGEVDWSVEVTDDYGHTATSETFTFLSPATLTFRSEQNPDKVLDELNVNVTAYYGDETVRRSTSNGEIDLTNFPVDEPIITRASGENYTTRTAVIESIYDQSNIYLLNSSVETYEVRFNLQDPTGAYNLDDTVLFVERDLERNGSVEWRTIAGDNFGIQGVPVKLKQNERYRLRIRNLETGATATVGSYTAIQKESVTLSPGSATIEIIESNQEYGWSAVQNESSQSILFEYFDTANQTDSVTLTIHERFNKSNVLVDNTTFTDANNIVYHEPLTDSEANRTWMAEIYVERGGQTFHFREPISGPGNDIIPADLGEGWRTGVGAFILLVTGMAFSALNRSSGAVATALVGGFLWQVGFLSLTTSGPMVVVAIFVSVVYHYRGGNP